ncbi:MAG: flagellar hook-basal body complex protein FliE [Clostridiales bacterium]|nr:flagellar hook-basal body complex protein FliE [Clostridiales bacterium]
MNVNPLSGSLINLISSEAASPAEPQASAHSFSSILTEAMDNVRQTDLADKGSALQLLTGQADDMSGLLLDAQKAEISLNLALQLRSKVLEAYNEIMRMQL